MEMRIVDFTAEYAAGGRPAPTYTGTAAFSMNVTADARASHVEVEAHERARIKIAREGYWSAGEARITALSIDG